MDEAQRLFESVKSLIELTEVYATVIGIVLIVVAVAAAFLLGQSVKDIEERVSKLIRPQVGEIVDKKLETSSNLAKSWDDLVSKVSGIEQSVPNIEKRLENLNRFADYSEGHSIDAYGAYERIQAILEQDDKAPSETTVEEIFEGRPSQAKKLTTEERDEIQDLLVLISRAGTKGEVTSNLLFNASQDASRVDMEYEALQLSVLADFFGPSPSHRITRLRKAAKLGVELKFSKPKGTKEGIFQTGDKSSEEVQFSALNDALRMVATAPLQQCEILYAEASNIADYLREGGAYSQLVDVLVRSYEVRVGTGIITPPRSEFPPEILSDKELWEGQVGGQIPSALTQKIAQLVTQIAAPDWKEESLKYLELTIELAAAESPAATWRQSALQGVQAVGFVAGLSEEVNGYFGKYF